MPKEWKEIKGSDSYEKDPSAIVHASNIVFINQKPISVNTLTSKVIYAELIRRIYKKPRALQNIERRIQFIVSQTINLDSRKIYMLPRHAVISTGITTFQYGLLNNIVYFSKNLFKMKLVESPLCSQCKTVDETSFHFLVLVLLLCTS